MFGAVDYSRSPSGSGDILSPVSVNVIADNFSDFAEDMIGANYWGIYIGNILPYPDSECVPSSTLSLSHNFDLVDGKYETIATFGSANLLTCNIEDAEFGYVLEQNYDGIFTIISASLSTAMFEVPTTTASDLTANITSQLGDTGTLALIVIVASIPLAFYVIKKIIGLVPKK